MNITLNNLLYFILVLLLSSTSASAAGKKNPARIIAKEPVTMMDIGLLKLNSWLSNLKQRSLRGAKIGARYNHRSGTIDIKISIPVAKASKKACKRILKDTKRLFVHTTGPNKKKVSNIHHYFMHEGTAYKNKINWKNLPKHVVITGIVLTKKNYQHSVYCKSKLMSKKVTY